MWLFFVVAALADIPNIDPCDRPPREICTNDGSVCPKDQPECGQLLAADGWSHPCTSWNGDEVWCAPPKSSGFCATTALVPPLVGLALLGLAATRRRDRLATANRARGS